MDVVQEAHKVLDKNRRVTDGHQYTQPSPGSYPYQWLWDSCFHAIALAKIGDVDAAKKEMLSLVSKQFSDGMVPHIIYWQPGDLHKYEWGKAGTSAITQPPMIPYAVWEIYKKDNDISFLKEMFPHLCSYFRYLLNERDPMGHHLLGIINPDESGEDNSPRFDEALKVPSDITMDEHLKKRLVLIENNKTCRFDAGLCMRNFFWVHDVPFNSIVIENLRILEHISAIVEDANQEHFCKTNIELISKSMREKLFEEGVFWSATDGISNFKKIKVATWAHFIPLFADLYTPEEAKVVVQEHLLNKNTFLSDYGIRTVSKQEESYRPTSESFSWRGPIWMTPHWFIYKGLEKYGFKEEAIMIRDKTMALLEKQGFREYYNPETGEGQGARDFTWGALIVDMIEG